MNVLPDRYHTKANTELEEEEQRDNTFISNKLEMHHILYKNNFVRKSFLFQSSYILKEVKSIHLTNLHSLNCEQVARLLTPSAKHKFNQLKLFFF